MRLVPGESPRADGLAVDDLLRAHLRSEHFDDQLVQAYAAAAVEWYEGAANRSLITSEWEAQFSAFPCGRLPLVLPRAPLVDVESIVYVSPGGAEVEMDEEDFEVLDGQEPGLVVPASSWPSVKVDRPDAVRVVFTAGYGESASSVPQRVQQVLRMLVAHWYDPARGPVVTGTIVSELPFALRSMFWNTRVFLGAA